MAQLLGMILSMHEETQCVIWFTGSKLPTVRQNFCCRCGTDHPVGKAISCLITTVTQRTLSITKYITWYSLLVASVAFTASATTLVLASWT